MPLLEALTQANSISPSDCHEEKEKSNNNCSPFFCSDLSEQDAIGSSQYNSINSLKPPQIPSPTRANTKETSSSTRLPCVPSHPMNRLHEFSKAPRPTMQRWKASQIKFAAGAALAWSAKLYQSIGWEESNAMPPPFTNNGNAAGPESCSLPSSLKSSSLGTGRWSVWLTLEL